MITDLFGYTIISAVRPAPPMEFGKPGDPKLYYYVHDWFIPFLVPYSVATAGPFKSEADAEAWIKKAEKL